MLGWNIGWVTAIHKRLPIRTSGLSNKIPPGAKKNIFLKSIFLEAHNGISSRVSLFLGNEILIPYTILRFPCIPLFCVVIGQTRW